MIDELKASPRCAASGKTLYLTFDDGPDNVWTPQIALYLKHEAVPATFFLSGWSPGFQKLFATCRAHHPGAPHHIPLAAHEGKRVVELLSETGHAIGIHGWNHMRYWYREPDRGFEQVEQVRLALVSILGERALPKLLRAPEGFFSPAGPIAGYEDWYYYEWTIWPEGYLLPHDPRTGTPTAGTFTSHHYKRPQDIVASLVTQLESLDCPDAPVILLHSIHSIVYDALARTDCNMLAALRALGYDHFALLPRPGDRTGYPIIERKVNWHHNYP